jgi:hypothetical protein
MMLIVLNNGLVFAEGHAYPRLDRMAHCPPALAAVSRNCFRIDLSPMWM